MVETSLGTFVSAYDGALDVSIRPECIELNLDTEGNYVVKECTFYGHDQVISFQNSKGEILELDHFQTLFMKLVTELTLKFLR